MSDEIPEWSFATALSFMGDLITLLEQSEDKRSADRRASRARAELSVLRRVFSQNADAGSLAELDKAGERLAEAEQKALDRFS